MDHNEETFDKKEQKHPDFPTVKAFDMEKLLAMQTQVVEGITQNKNSQQRISGPVRRQVAEAWKNMRNHGSVGSNTSGYQDQCHCCEHYGLPCLRNMSSKKEVKTKPTCVTNEDKKRKAKALEPRLGSDQHPNPKMSHVASNSRQENSNLGDEQIPQANPTAHEVCIDGWTITYREFQPRRIKQCRKKSNQAKINHQSMQVDNTPNNTSVENNITEEPAKRRCYHCQQEGHYISSCPQKKQQMHREDNHTKSKI
jgi:hypothetical protein